MYCFAILASTIKLLQKQLYYFFKIIIRISNIFSHIGSFLYFCKNFISIMEKSLETVSKIMEKIKTLRKEKGYSNENMANDLNISTSAYNKMERMEVSISLERFIRIREILDVPYSEFFENTIKNVYKQDLKDNSIGHYEVQTLNQENRETTKKLIEMLENEILHLKDEVVFLREIVKK
jgi:transcriptional regulator with XRE-family HTH domain